MGGSRQVYNLPPASQFIQNQRDAACNQVAGRLTGFDLNQLHRKGDVVGAQDEAIKSLSVNSNSLPPADHGACE
jgi:hypothetical protein